MSRPLSGAHRHGQASIEPTPEHSTTGPPQSSSLHSASLQIIEWADEVLATLDANSNWARRRKKHVSQRASLNAGRRVTKQAQAQVQVAIDETQVPEQSSPESFLTRLRRVELTEAPPATGLTLSHVPHRLGGPPPQQAHRS